MAFNKGYELKKFEAHWEKLRIEYAAAGMAEDAIQKMYDYDRQQFNSERTRMHFVELYHGEFSEERLIRALGNVHPMEIYRVGRDNPAKLPGWKKYVFPIYMAYNGKGRKDALSMKF